MRKERTISPCHFAKGERNTPHWAWPSHLSVRNEMTSEPPELRRIKEESKLLLLNSVGGRMKDVYIPHGSYRRKSLLEFTTWRLVQNGAQYKICRGRFLRAYRLHRIVSRRWITLTRWMTRMTTRPYQIFTTCLPQKMSFLLRITYVQLTIQGGFYCIYWSIFVGEI
jgi:hypothetical protein